MSAEHELRDNIYKNYGHDFQDNGEIFDSAAAEKWGKAYHWYMRRWLPAEKDAAIGEMAPGNGKFLHFLKQLGYTRLSAVDISTDQVKLARQVIDDVMLGSALDWLAEREGSFDLLIAFDLIEHFTRAEALEFLDKCFRALKPGGRLVLQTPNADSPFGLQLRYGDITHEFCFSTTLLNRLLARTGFVGIEGREMGPPPYGYSLIASVRWGVWRIVRSLIQIANIAEQGGSQSVLTRVFLMSGHRP